MIAKKESALVSVIIPAFNVATIIERTIQSVLEQTYKNFEILVIDDGSTDRTGEVIDKLAAEDKRIRLLQQENQGVAAARNLGIKYARGDYIAPLDADDYWFPEKLEKQVAAMSESPSAVGLVYTWTIKIFENDRPRVFYNGWEEEGSVFLPLLLGNFLSNASTPLISRECFDHIGMYNMDFLKFDAQGCEDWDIYLRIAEHYEFRVVPEHLTGYRQSKESMSADWKLMARSYQFLMDLVRKRHPEIPAFVFRWSRSNYFLYLANKAARAQHDFSSLLLLTRATATDPFMLTNRRLLRMAGKNLLQLVRSERISSQSSSQPKVPTQENRHVDKNTAVGMSSVRRLKQRTEKLVQLQKKMRLDVTPNIGPKESSGQKTQP